MIFSSKTILKQQKIGGLYTGKRLLQDHGHPSIRLRRRLVSNHSLIKAIAVDPNAINNQLPVARQSSKTNGLTL